MRFSVETRLPSADELIELYRAVGWSAYTDVPQRLVDAVAASHLVLTAREDDGSLIGLVRTVSDGHTIVYIQDLLVAPSCQRQGVGGSLLDEVVRRSSHIRQNVLLTDAEAGQRAFYESRGFSETHDVRPNELRSFVRMS
jgi:ribosomal protein S18 acetylase RimI-like enzyme